MVNETAAMAPVDVIEVLMPEAAPAAYIQWARLACDYHRRLLSWPMVSEEILAQEHTATVGSVYRFAFIVMTAELHAQAIDAELAQAPTVAPRLWVPADVIGHLAGFMRVYRAYLSHRPEFQESSLTAPQLGPELDRLIAQAANVIDHTAAQSIDAELALVGVGADIHTEAFVGAMALASVGRS